MTTRETAALLAEVAVAWTRASQDFPLWPRVPVGSFPSFHVSDGALLAEGIGLRGLGLELFVRCRVYPLPLRAHEAATALEGMEVRRVLTAALAWCRARRYRREALARALFARERHHIAEMRRLVASVYRV